MGIKKKHVPGNTCCGDTEDNCGCLSSTNPESWTVVISGIVDNNCSSCSRFNGTFTVTRVSTCLWVYSFADAVCKCPLLSAAVDKISVSVNKSAGPTKIIVGIDFTSQYYDSAIPCHQFAGTAAFAVTLADRDCAVTNLTVPYNTGNETPCTFSGASVVVTAN